MVIDSDKVAQSSVHYNEGCKVRHPLKQVSNNSNDVAINTVVEYC